MTTLTHRSSGPSLKQPADTEQVVSKQVATGTAPSGPAFPPKTGGPVAAPRPRKLKGWLIGLAVLVLLLGAGLAWVHSSGADVRASLAASWQRLMGSDAPEGFALTNGRIEATKVYITTKLQGRIESVLVREGDTIEVGQVLARMDTRTLQAQLRQAEAQIQRAKDKKTSSIATVTQREAELEFWMSDLERHRKLLPKGATSQEIYEGTLAKWKAGGAILQAAKSQVVEDQAAIDVAIAEADRLRVDIDDGILRAPRRGRVQYRLAEPGEVLAPGGRVLDTIDLTDAYMLFYLPEAEAGKVTIGGEARLVLDALPDAVIPATVYFVESEAQFTPKSVETRTERQKLAFQVRARIDADLLKNYESLVKVGLPGVVYVRLDPSAPWSERLQVKLPALPGTEAAKPWTP